MKPSLTQLNCRVDYLNEALLEKLDENHPTLSCESREDIVSRVMKEFEKFLQRNKEAQDDFISIRGEDWDAKIFTPLFEVVEGVCVDIGLEINFEDEKESGLKSIEKKDDDKPLAHQVHLNHQAELDRMLTYLERLRCGRNDDDTDSGSLHLEDESV